MTKRNIKYVCKAARWFDRINGNTYHSVRVTRCRDGAVIVGAFQYGYGTHYKQTALLAMAEAKWVPVRYRSNGAEWQYERENNYPIEWVVTDGLKRDCVANGVA